MTAKVRILIVDDEEDILEFLKYNLEKENFEVKTASNGQSALKKAKKFSPHLIILDIMMPEMDGIEVCENLRSDEQFNDTIIAFLTARNESYTQIAALDKGGDDFIQKPIKLNVFKSRITALLRRHPELNTKTYNSSIVDIGNIKINHDKFTVIVNDTEITLAKKEFELLSLLASKPGKVFKRNQIMSRVWGDDVMVGDRTIDVHIRKLREKLGNSTIATLKGVGYKLEV